MVPPVCQSLSMALIYLVGGPRCRNPNLPGLRWFAREVNRRPPDALVVAGPLTAGRPARDLPVATRWLMGLGAPLLLAPEPTDFSPLHYLTSKFNPWPSDDFLERDRRQPLHLPGAVLVPLPLRRSARGYAVDRGGLKRALDCLTECKPGMMRILVAERPLLQAGPDQGPAVEYGATALKLLVEAGVEALLTSDPNELADGWIKTDVHAIRFIAAPHRSDNWSYLAIRTDGGVLTVEQHFQNAGSVNAIVPPPLSLASPWVQRNV